MADGKAIKVTVDVVSPGNAGANAAKKVMSGFSAEAARINAQTAANARQTDRIITDSKKQTARQLEAEIKRVEREEKRAAKASADAFIKSLKETEQVSRTTTSNISKDFSNIINVASLTYLASKAKDVLGSVVDTAADYGKKGIEFIGLQIALSRIEGSAEKARQKIAELRTIPGIDVNPAIKGQIALEGLGFSAQQATGFIRGLSNIRFFSGAQKQDVDAVLYNLAQIKANGKLTGDELKETLMRLPLLAPLMERAFGTLNVKGKSATEFLTKLLEELNKVPKAADGSMVAFENFEKATNRLQTGIGVLIARSPELNALFSLMTNGLNQNSEKLEDFDSVQAKTLSGFISWIAKSALSVNEFALKSGVYLKYFGTQLGALQIQSVGVLARIAQAFINLGVDIHNTFSGVINAAIAGINTLTSAIKNIPNLTSISPILGAVQGIPEIQPLKTLEYANFGSRMLESAANYSASFDSEKARNEFNRITDVTQKMRREFENLTVQYYKENQARQDINKKLFDNNKGGNKTNAGGEGGKGKRREALTREERNYRHLVEFAKEQGFFVTSTTKGKHNANSPHYAGMAIDVRTKTRSAQEIGEFIAAAIKAGYRVVDERVRPAGQKVWKGAHLHLETNNRRESTLNPSLSYGSIPIGLLRKLDNERFVRKSAGGIGADDVERYTRDQSDVATKAEREKNLKFLIRLHILSGLIPSADLTKEFTRMAVEEAQKQGVVQPSESEVANYFKENAFAKQQGRLPFEVSTEQTTVSDSLVTRGRAEAVAKYEETIESLRFEIMNLNAVTDREKWTVRLLTDEYLGLTDAEKEAILSKVDLIDASNKAKDAAEKEKDEQQKALEAFQDRQREVFDNTKDYLRNLLDDSVSGRWKGILDSILGNIKNFVVDATAQFATMKLLGFGGSSGSGGFLGSILGGIGNLGSFPGGTAPFNPSGSGEGSGLINSAATSGSNGLFSQILGKGAVGKWLGKTALGKFLGIGVGAGTAAAGAGAAAISGAALPLGSAGAAILGPSAAALTLGTTGGAGLAGTGIGGAGAAGSAGMLAFLTNPFTIAAVGAAVGGFLLYKYFNRNKSEKKLKKAAFEQYSLRVEDMATLKSLKQIGESTLGKGIASKDEGARAVVQLDSSQELLREYATRTGQKSAKLNASYLTDPNAPENQFTSKFGGYREYGGAVRAGYSYIVGERRPELFTPNVSGFISPSVPATDSKMFAGMARMMAEMTAVLEELTGRMNSISYGEIVAVGASSASREIAGAFISETNNNARLGADLSRGTGNYT